MNIKAKELSKDHPAVQAAHMMVEAHRKYHTMLPACEEVGEQFPGMEPEQVMLLWIGVNAKDLVEQKVAVNEMHINEIAARHYDWVERMGWHNKSTLEALALIASEVGEAVNECRGDKPSINFGTELADIILRVVDLAHWQGIDLAETIADKMAVNEARGTRGRRI